MKIPRHPSRPDPALIRYLINGLVSTAVHFAVLSTLIGNALLHSAGLANLLASCAGISCSFLGSRYFVFPGRDGHAADHALKFAGLYAAVALLNGGVLLVWTDLWGKDYRTGFLIGTGLQILASYTGNKHFVFTGNQRSGTRVIRFLVAGLGFTALLIAFNLLHSRYFAVDVVFYAAFADALLASLAAALALFTWPYFRIFGAFERALMVLCFVLAGYAFAISVPTVIDRSLSFYILEKLQQRGGGIRTDRIHQVFTDEYMSEHRLVDVRLTEQAESGTIEIDRGCVKLTARGERLASLSRFYRRHFLPRHRLLAGEYTDDLTDPFRHQTPDPGYGCR